MLMLAIAGCGIKNTSSDSNNSQSPTPPSTPSSPQQPDAAATLPDHNPEPIPQPEAPIVAGTAMYRGFVTEIIPIQDSEGIAVTLEQAEGTNFGHISLAALLVGDTRLNNLNLGDLHVGDYLEIFYGGTPSDNAEVTAITARKMPGGDLAVFNGEIVQNFPKEGESRTGDLLMRELHSENQHLFHYSPEYTQFYLDFDSLTPGDKLNIIYNGVSTRSIPPQSTANEVRYYYTSTD